MTLSPDITTILTQVESFGASNLPQTMKLANVLRKVIQPELEQSTRELPFDDRVLAWLAPALRRDMVLYHGGKGGSLSDLFPTQALEHLDRDLFALLCRRLESKRVDLAAAIRRLVKSEAG